MRSSVFILLFLASFFSSANSAPQVGALDSANQLYRKGDYSLAAEKYESVLQKGFRSASVYYNLGNAYYRTGKLGYAILNYERAYKLAPSDEDIRHNLEVGRARITDKEDALPQFFLFNWWESLQSLFTADGWTIVTYVFYLVLLLSVAAIFVFTSVSIRRYSLYISLLAGVLFLISAVNLFAKFSYSANQTYAVVLTPSVSVRSAPEEKGTESFIIHEGLKVRMEDTLEGWFRIRLKDGNSGWVKKNTVAEI